MLLQAMLQDSIDAQKKTQAKIAVELATREKEKASRDSLIEEKIAALEGVQTELDALQAESKDSSQLMLIALGVLALILVGALVFVMGRSRQQQPPIPPWMYPPPRPPKKKKKKAKKEKKTKKEDKEEAPKEAPKEEPAPEAVAAPVEAAPEAPEPESQQVIGDDPNVLKSEIDDIRKTVVSMSVGQPGRTSTIVKEWLEQPAPAPPEPEEESGDGDEDDEE
jgi:hypothetical protein